jgi:hypothetical protein
VAVRLDFSAPEGERDAFIDMATLLNGSAYAASAL